MVPRIIIFTQKGNPALFDGYLKIKFEVFVEEMGWSGIPHDPMARRALPDHVDRESTFSAALDENDVLIGVVRGTLPRRIVELYRVERFADVIAQDFVGFLEGRIATMNALAVQSNHRHERFHPATTDVVVPQVRPHVAETLMRSTILELTAQGAEIILASALAGPSHALVRGLGFTDLGPARGFGGAAYSLDPKAPEMQLFDVALVTRAFCEDEASDVPTEVGPEILSTISQFRIYLSQLSAERDEKDRSNV